VRVRGNCIHISSIACFLHFTLLVNFAFIKDIMDNLTRAMALVRVFQAQAMVRLEGDRQPCHVYILMHLSHTHTHTHTHTQVREAAGLKDNERIGILEMGKTQGSPLQLLLGMCCFCLCGALCVRVLGVVSQPTTGSLPLQPLLL